VSDKGCDMILEALDILKPQNIFPTLTVIGEGPELSSLQGLCEKFGLTGQVSFAGAKTGKELCRILNEHKILAAPSLWNEPFGKVALEGLACGCKVIVPDAGGFPEAAGPSGILFEKGNVEDLAKKIKQTLETDLAWHKDE